MLYMRELSMYITKAQTQEALKEPTSFITSDQTGLFAVIWTNQAGKKE